MKPQNKVNTLASTGKHLNYLCHLNVEQEQSETA